ncbi:glycerol-3-phosphate responsive antiterminator [Oceanobacillus damuensis]|uniref:glycerol-3-phosphate responsive antiterminator n=1 Tax=Oceanobacillus damuensis TaxID=937928 RepID=UPI00082E95A7|nr:glycerol-3-phosphate responsive antiterminator [Oceanobacillus damuensis]
MDIPSGILPAIRKMKDFDKALETSHDTIIILESRLVQIKSLVEYTRKANKKVLIHFDLIQGLKSDEFGVEFLIREVKPDGILSTRGNVINLAKKHKLLAIQRIFLLDSLALDHNLKLIEKIKPDCIEVLPGLMPTIIEQISQETSIPIIAGGLIKSDAELQAAMQAGAVAVSTSNKSLWKF